MRKTLTGLLVGAVATTALTVSSPAGAVTAVTRVDGNHFAASGVRIASQGCLDASAKPTKNPKFRIAKGPGSPPLGNRSIGWTPQEDGFGVGPMTHVDSPSSLTVLGISVFAPESHAAGQAVVQYVAPGTTGIWKGTYALGADSTSGWHAVNAATGTFSWRHVTDGVADQDAPTATIADFVASHGGDGTGAWVGFVYGCAGAAFFVDALHVSTTNGERTLNFQGYGTRTSVLVGKKARRSVTTTYGKALGLTARLQKLAGGAGMSGKLRIDSRPLSAKKWTHHDKRKVGRKGTTSFSVRASKSVAYRASYAGAGTYERSTSRVLKIRVAKKITAGLVDKTVTRGHSFTAAGKVLPARALKVTLERYLRGKWRTVKRGSSDRQGHFRLSSTAKSLGASYWRVTVAAGGGTLGARSKVLKLNTNAPPSSGGGGGGGGGTPGDPGDPPPPPPPPGPQRSWVG